MEVGAGYHEVSLMTVLDDSMMNQLVAEWVAWWAVEAVEAVVGY
jgi:hypothetical protein